VDRRRPAADHSPPSIFGQKLLGGVATSGRTPSGSRR